MIMIMIAVIMLLIVTVFLKLYKKIDVNEFYTKNMNNNSLKRHKRITVNMHKPRNRLMI